MASKPEPEIQVSICPEIVYAAASTNRHENGISCSKNFLLYSRSNSPVVHDLNSTIQRPNFLIGHQDEVNGQSFIEKIDESDKGLYILSTAYDGNAIIWYLQESNNKHDLKIDHQQFDPKILYSFKSSSEEVFTTRCAIKLKGDQFMSVTTTIDGLVHLRCNEQVKQEMKTTYCCFHSKIHSINMNSGIIFTFLFLAGGDNKIHVFLMDTDELTHLFDIAGHHDWVKCLDTISLPPIRRNEFLVASASQDSYVRVWHMRLINHEIARDDIRTTCSKLLINAATGEVTNYRLTSTLETVLSGHEGIVHGLCWFKNQRDNKLQLATCSADKTIALWNSNVALIEEGGDAKQYSAASAGVWKESVRLGETGETNLPFLGICVNDNKADDDATFYAQSLRGAIHSWKYHSKSKEWQPQSTIMGHFGSVTDLSWEKTGAYLLSSSLDKTIRMHAVASQDSQWHELTRPQVHGHEINCLASVDFARFASGAEEKTIRVFGATQFFVRNFEVLSEAKKTPFSKEEITELPAHAQLPALGLSNRGAQSPYDMGKSAEDQQKTANPQDTWYSISPMVERLSKMNNLEELPIEEILLQSTLWWETNKLFGHSNELHALAVDSKSTFVASASKANRTDLASIIIWDASQFRKVANIEHHSLTITRLKFSPNDKYLLSVSRDRTWCLSVRNEGQLRNAYKKLTGTCKADCVHQRIIWDCCWTHDSRYFMTVSRDKQAILWKLDECVSPKTELSTGSSPLVEHFPESLQAVDSPDCVQAIPQNSYLFALGLEDGSLYISLVDIETRQWTHLYIFKKFHLLPIRRLAFQPTTSNPVIDMESNSDRPTKITHALASGGDDSVVKITNFALK